MGGGIRTLENIRRFLISAFRVIIGTRLRESWFLLKATIDRFGAERSMTVVGVDARRMVLYVVSGAGREGQWPRTALSLALAMKVIGVQTIVYVYQTVCSCRSNVEQTKILSDKTGIDIIASRQHELHGWPTHNTNDAGIHGAIIGRLEKSIMTRRLYHLFESGASYSKAS